MATLVNLGKSLINQFYKQINPNLFPKLGFTPTRNPLSYRKSIEYLDLAVVEVILVSKTSDPGYIYPQQPRLGVWHRIFSSNSPVTLTSAK